jgi:prepilin-type N-terminal cleavage/methylation domain-containing protein
VNLPPTTISDPRTTHHAPRTTPAFTLLEILVAITLLSIIVLGLFAMFNQTQRAFRSSMTQSDILEAGRAVTEMIPRELEQALPSYRNAVNFSAVVIANSAPLTQWLPGAVAPNQLQRTNFLEDVYILVRQNQTWTGIGYCVRTNDIAGRLWLPEISPGQLGAGSLYRFETNFPVLGANGLAQDPGLLFITFTNACLPGKTNIYNRICDGVVHFRLQATATNGYPLFGNGAYTNACFRTNTLTTGFSPVRHTLTVQNFAYPNGLSGLYFMSNALPATLELELGLLEKHSWERYNSIGAPAPRLTYLQRDDISSRVHLFRQRIAVRNVDPLAYQ